MRSFPIVFAPIVFVMAASAFAAFPAHANPPLSAYGELPNVDRMDIAPDGNHFAYVLRDGDAEALVIFKKGQGISGGAKIEKGKIRRVSFAGPNHVILQASLAVKQQWVRGKYEFSSAAAYNVNTNKLQRLLRYAPDIYNAQTGAGRVIGLHKGHDEIFMPAFASLNVSSVGYVVYKANLNTGRSTLLHKGGDDVGDWFVDTDGSVLAREDFSRRNEFYSIRTIRDGEWTSVFSEKTDEPPFTLVGVKPDKSGLIAYFDPEEDGYSSLFELSFDGVRSPPVFARNDAEIASIFSDANRFVLGVGYTGLFPEYQFYDPAMTEAMNAVQTAFAGSSVHLAGWTDDFGQLLLSVAGSRRAPAYYLYLRESGAVQKIANRYDDINDGDVGEILTIEYKARDGLKIPAIISLPPSVSGAPNQLPMIVMPHGGPESYDGVGFDWLAQYFANRGYLVFQPNFRGSGGFGAAFSTAGHGEWGGKMQDDITDGVKLLIKNGWADKNRVCIVGGSYGGYAALAGGAYTPELYKCVAAIAPVSDVKLMLRREKRDWGGNSLTFDYWQKLIGELRKDSAKLEAISPANFAQNFTAPVLLIHGKDDTVVPLIQSRRMENALEKAGKPVEFVLLKKEDHWLSQSETRLQTLKALDQFVEANIGGGQ